MTGRLEADAPRGESGSLLLPAIVVHGGAGTFERAARDGASAALLEDGLLTALEAGWRAFASGGSSLEAVVETVAALEDSGLFNAGRGAVPRSDGSVQFDAGVMDGRSGIAGSVAAATWPANPVRAARELAGMGGAPEGPVLLAGEGADRFALERGLPQMRRDRLTGVPGADDAPPSPHGTDDAPPSPHGTDDAPPSPHGTVGAVAVDRAGALAAATSTGGRSGQLPGRVGDSPIPGAGVWAADDAVAVSATGAGEAFLLAGFGHRIDWCVRSGSSLLEAVDAALASVTALGAEGGGIALQGDGTFATRFTSAAMARGWRDAGGAVAHIL